MNRQNRSPRVSKSGFLLRFYSTENCYLSYPKYPLKMSKNFKTGEITYAIQVKLRG